MKDNNDVFKLIDYCIKKGVKRVKVRDVEVEFGEKVAQKRVYLRKSDKSEIIEDELDRLLVEDPLLRERLIEREVVGGD